MTNPLFDSFGNAAQGNFFANLMQQAQQLKQSFKGNPREEVERLLKSGEMSQAQFNQYAQVANQMMNMFNK